jgi:DNA-binding LacI/PurR family transcriptional regulator
MILTGLSVKKVKPSVFSCFKFKDKPLEKRWRTLYIGNVPNKTETLVNLIELAKLTGLSKSSVSRALTNHPAVSEETRRTVLEAARKHGYTASALGRGLRGAGTRMLAVVSSSASSGYSAEVIEGANSAAKKAGYHIMCALAHSDADYSETVTRVIGGGLFDGVILAAPPESVFKCSAAADRIPVTVCSAKPLPGCRSQWKKVSSVTVDNMSAQTALLESLHQRGHRKFLYFRGPSGNFDARERLAAFEIFIKSKGGVSAQVLECSGGAMDARRQMTEYIKDGGIIPDAVAAFNDKTAAGVIRALNENGLKAAVSGFDGETFSEFLGFCSAEMPFREIGDAAAETVLARLRPGHANDEPEHIKLKLRVTLRY